MFSGIAAQYGGIRFEPVSEEAPAHGAILA
jgi:hypothetical protein